MPKLLRGLQAAAVEGCAPRIPRTESHVHRDRRLRPRAGDSDPSRIGAEAHDLRIAARARGEALRSDVQSLEEVRLACPVWTRDEHHAGLELQFQPGIRAKVAERDLANDQLASNQ